MSQRRVVVTGMGVVTPIGVGLTEFRQALFAGTNGIRRITHFDPSGFRSQIAGEVDTTKLTGVLSPKDSRRMDRFTQFAIVAAEEAIQHSGLDLSNGLHERMGVLVGSGVGGLETIEREQSVLLAKGPSRVSPLLVPMLITNIASAYIAIRYGLMGPNFSISTACATGTHAIGEAFRIVQRGDADTMLAGGAEAAITPLGLAGFCSMRALSTRNDEPHRASRPFDKERDGFVVGEGASVVVLEELAQARRRKAYIWGEIVGFGMSCDAYHITQPVEGGRGIHIAMKQALQSAALNLEEINYINAHGTSTLYNDKTETQAVKQLFGQHAYSIPISSTKSMTGHLLGATGAVELTACILAFEQQLLPPTINYEYPDPDCDLDYVPNLARQAQVKVAISNSMGFGGHNATLAIRQYS